MEKVFDSVLKTIGKTPMVQLDRLKAAWKLEGTLLAKLENLNPGSSKKDRIALRMIEEAESSGELGRATRSEPLWPPAGVGIVCRRDYLCVMSRAIPWKGRG